MALAQFKGDIVFDAQNVESKNVLLLRQTENGLQGAFYRRKKDEYHLVRDGPNEYTFIDERRELVALVSEDLVSLLKTPLRGPRGPQGPPGSSLTGFAANIINIGQVGQVLLPGGIVEFNNFLNNGISSSGQNSLILPQDGVYEAVYTATFNNLFTESTSGLVTSIQLLLSGNSIPGSVRTNGISTDESLKEVMGVVQFSGMCGQPVQLASNLSTFSQLASPVGFSTQPSIFPLSQASGQYVSSLTVSLPSVQIGSSIFASVELSGGSVLSITDNVGNLYQQAVYSGNDLLSNSIYFADFVGLPPNPVPTTLNVLFNGPVDGGIVQVEQVTSVGFPSVSGVTPGTITTFTGPTTVGLTFSSPISGLIAYGSTTVSPSGIVAPSGDGLQNATVANLTGQDQFIGLTTGMNSISIEINSGSGLAVTSAVVLNPLPSIQTLNPMTNATLSLKLL